MNNNGDYTVLYPGGGEKLVRSLNKQKEGGKKKKYLGQNYRLNTERIKEQSFVAYVVENYNNNVFL